MPLDRFYRALHDEAERAGVRLRAGAERVVAAGARGSAMKVACPVGRVFRDLTMPIVLKQVARHVRQEWMYAYHIDWDEPIRAAA